MKIFPAVPIGTKKFFILTGTRHPSLPKIFFRAGTWYPSKPKIFILAGTHRYPKCFFSGRYRYPSVPKKFFWPAPGTQRYPTSKIYSVPGTHRYSTSKICSVPSTQRYPISNIFPVPSTQRYPNFQNFDGYRSHRPLIRTSFSLYYSVIFNKNKLFEIQNWTLSCIVSKGKRRLYQNCDENSWMKKYDKVFILRNIFSGFDSYIVFQILRSKFHSLVSWKCSLVVYLADICSSPRLNHQIFVPNISLLKYSRSSTCEQKEYIKSI